jgi:hypothetical protein
VNLIKGKKINWPRLINDNEIMSIGSTRLLIDALRIACADMVDWLMSDYGFERYDAVQLLGQTAHLYIYVGFAQGTWRHNGALRDVHGTERSCGNERRFPMTA